LENQSIGHWFRRCSTPVTDLLGQHTMVEVGVNVVRHCDALSQWSGGIRGNVFGDTAIDGPLAVIL
jgi:hypothetical protein